VDVLDVLISNGVDVLDVLTSNGVDVLDVLTRNAVHVLTLRHAGRISAKGCVHLRKRKMANRSGVRHCQTKRLQLSFSPSTRCPPAPPPLVACMAVAEPGDGCKAVAEPGDQGAATALHALGVHQRMGMQHMPRLDKAAHAWHA